MLLQSARREGARGGAAGHTEEVAEEGDVGGEECLLRGERGEVRGEGRDERLPGHLQRVRGEVQRPPLARVAVGRHLRLLRREGHAERYAGGLEEGEEAVVGGLEEGDEARLRDDALDVVVRDGARHGALVSIGRRAELLHVRRRELHVGWRGRERGARGAVRVPLSTARA